MTALTLYQSNDTSATLATAKKLYTTNGGSTTSHTTGINSSSVTGWDELIALGNSGHSWAGLGSAPSTPNGTGLIFDVTTLEGQTIPAGDWQTTIRLAVSAGNADIDLRIHYFKYTGSSYISIGFVQKLNFNVTTTQQDITTTLASLGSAAFNTGEKLYIAPFVRIINNNTGSPTCTFSWSGFGTTAGSGALTYATTTPGYAATVAPSFSATIAATSAISVVLTGNNPAPAVLPGLRVTMAGQDISAWVQESSIDIKANMAQQGGTGAGSGRAGTCDFLTALGPVGRAIGAGQPFTGTTFARAVESDSPLVYFRFGEDAGTAPTDDIGGLLQMTLVGGVTQGTDTLLNNDTDKSIHFNGTDSLLTLSGYGQPTGNSPWTIMSLFKLDDYPTGAVGTIAKMGVFQTNEGCSIGVTSAGYAVVSIRNNLSLTDTTPLQLDTIHLLAGIYDGTTLYLMLDGQLLYQGDPGTTPNLNVSNLNVGGITGQARWFPGYVDELAIFNYAIDPTRIASYWDIATLGPMPDLVRRGKVIIEDYNGNRVYGGYATQLSDATMGVQNFTTVSCSDFWQALDDTTVDERYENMSDTAMLLDLCAKYAPQIDTSLVSTAQNILIPRKPFRGKTLRYSLQAIANITGFSIWVDAYERLHYESPSSATTAPFALSTAPDNLTSFGHRVEDYDVDDTGVINKVRFYGGNRPSEDFTQDLSPQANGNNTIFVLAYYPHPASDGNVTVQVGGVTQAVGAAFGDTTDLDNVLKSAGGNADALMDKAAKTILFDVAPDNDGPDSVTCKYRYQVPTIVEVSDADSIDFFGATYEASLSDETVFDPAVAYQRCRVLLAQQSLGLVNLKVVCWRPGLVPGMLLQVTNTTRGIGDSYQIQSVEVEPLGGGEFAYHLALGAWNWNLVDLLLAQARATEGIDQNDDDIATNVLLVEQYNLQLNMTIAVTYTQTTTGAYYVRATADGDGHDAYCGFCTISS